jgi:hypothetical protein
MLANWAMKMTFLACRAPSTQPVPRASPSRYRGMAIVNRRHGEPFADFCDVSGNDEWRFP